MKKIMVVCGNGLGTSLMMEMAVKEVAKKLVLMQKLIMRTYHQQHQAMLIFG